MTNLIDCRDYRSVFDSKLKSFISKFDLKITVAIVLVGENPASLVYVRKKIESMEKVGISSRLIKLDRDTKQENLINEIDNLNKDSETTGMIVQFPLPNQIDSFKILTKIDPGKDLDGLNPFNSGLLNTVKANGIYNMDLESLKIDGIPGRDFPIISCTPLGIIDIIQGQNFELSGKSVVVFGNSNLVGKPISRLLMLYGATVTVIHSKSKNIINYINNADVIISAVGKKNLISKDLIKDSNIKLIMDVGINFDESGKICGDVDRNLYDSSDFPDLKITRVPNGVGPMTIAGLMFNAALIEFSKKNYYP